MISYKRNVGRFFNDATHVLTCGIVFFSLQRTEYTQNIKTRMIVVIHHNNIGAKGVQPRTIAQGQGRRAADCRRMHAGCDCRRAGCRGTPGAHSANRQRHRRLLRQCHKHRKQRGGRAQPLPATNVDNTATAAADNAGANVSQFPEHEFQFDKAGNSSLK